VILPIGRFFTNIELEGTASVAGLFCFFDSCLAAFFFFRLRRVLSLAFLWAIASWEGGGSAILLPMISSRTSILSSPSGSEDFKSEFILELTAGNQKLFAD
jgi:hypothetical protein